MSERTIFHTDHLIALQLLSTSKGNQRKWYDPSRHYYIKEQFFYQNHYWRDDLVEVIAVKIASQLQTGNIEVTPQYLCDIDDFGSVTHGVYSEDFSKGKWRFVSFRRLLDMGPEDYEMSKDVEKNWNSILSYMNTFTKDDCTEYLIIMSILDYLVGNEDRHLNNFGLLSDGTDFNIAPLFDFGLGLFEHDRKYDGVPYRKCLNMMQSKPFSSDNQEVMDYLEDRYDLQKYLPETIDLTGAEIPSPKAGSYLRNHCMRLHIELRGAD